MLNNKSSILAVISLGLCGSAFAIPSMPKCLKHPMRSLDGVSYVGAISRQFRVTDGTRQDVVDATKAKETADQRAETTRTELADLPELSLLPLDTTDIGVAALIGSDEADLVKVATMGAVKDLATKVQRCRGNYHHYATARNELAAALKAYVKAQTQAYEKNVTTSTETYNAAKRINKPRLATALVAGIGATYIVAKATGLYDFVQGFISGEDEQEVFEDDE